MNETEYRALPATSFTRDIKPIVCESPAHAYHRAHNPSADTASRAFLRAVHCLVLEPEQFAVTFWVMPKGMDRGDINRTREAMTIDTAYPSPIIEDNAAGKNLLACLMRDGAAIVADNSTRNKGWKEKAAQLPPGTVTAKTKTIAAARKVAAAMDDVEQIGDREILSQSEHERAQRIADKVRSHPLMAAALAHPEACAEQSFVWDDPTVGRSKGRADLVIPGVLTLDLKTYRTDDPSRVANDICGNAWDVQAAWYERGYQQATGVDMSDAARVTVVAVEGSGDYAGLVTVGWFEHSDAMRAVGDARLGAALDTIAACRDSGTWPSKCPEEGAVVDPPRWAVVAAGLDPEDI